MFITVRLLADARPAMLRQSSKPLWKGWIDRWFDVGDIRLVDNLSELCPCAEVRNRLSLTFDSSIEHLVRQPPFVNVSTLLICGYFQSWKYAFAVDDELRRRLRWKPNITSAVRR